MTADKATFTRSRFNSPAAAQTIRSVYRRTHDRLNCKAVALENKNLNHLTAAQGYIELGMPMEANAELTTYAALSST
jgi:hypothetical protein